ncbi:heterokaryon incompatibility protein-domain-containing protein [Pseudomassariella vexata]|uniref:Heterokaryon incompatibility protein-domain-containing protein n=1 Tax=Pseudomassariella vexata TaxID=1141098 RepID=A0A1Y2DNF6_9PEZI|nr:heterokaryon incompatibility protein-domain-containing protein [Pseudomassariella vexata]ORY60666.1 heterokaryon incompatibility protein-domain-containing protein [Pseudomassariella vexata]
MDEEIDKTLNGAGNFQHCHIDATNQIRLLRIQYDKVRNTISYGLEAFPIADLSRIQYKALSYTWGCAHILDDVREIWIDGQSFFVRRNLCEFLTAAAKRGHQGLIFIDAICICQVDDEERNRQVEHMARIFCNAHEVIAWLGFLDEAQLENVQALSHTKDRECTLWTPRQWRGFRYISYHAFWTRVWIVQEVLLAKKMTVWCGAFTFPLSLFAGSSSSQNLKTTFNSCGITATTANVTSRLISPAETIVNDRLRQVLRPIRDPLAEGTCVGTLEEMTANLIKPTMAVETYQARTPDLLYHVIRKFGKLECSDPRDKLYGFLGILNERSRERVVPDYTKDVRYALYQALRLGIEELYCEHSSVTQPFRNVHANGAYLGYYCDVRDAFNMDNDETMPILRQVLLELRFDIQLQDATTGLQWRRQIGWDDIESRSMWDFQAVVAFAKPRESKPQGASSRSNWFRSRSRHYKGWILEKPREAMRIDEM